MKPYCGFKCQNEYNTQLANKKSSKVPKNGLKRIKKKVKKPKLSALRNKADSLASSYYRNQTPYCQAQAFSNIPCKGILNWCHIYSRSVSRLRYEPYNNLIMCAGHHLYFGYHPVEWVDFCDKHFPEKINEARKHRYEYFKPTAEHYDAWIRHFMLQ